MLVIVRKCNWQKSTMYFCVQNNFLFDFTFIKTKGTQSLIEYYNIGH